MVSQAEVLHPLSNTARGLPGPSRALLTELAGPDCEDIGKVQASGGHN